MPPPVAPMAAGRMLGRPLVAASGATHHLGSDQYGRADPAAAAAATASAAAQSSLLWKEVRPLAPGAGHP